MVDCLNATRLNRLSFRDIQIIVFTFIHGVEIQHSREQGRLDEIVLKDRLYHDLRNEIRRIFSGHSSGRDVPVPAR